MSTCPLFAHSLNDQTVLFDPYIGPYRMLSFRARIDTGAIAIKRYSTFPKARTLPEPHHLVIFVISRTFVGGGGFYSFVVKQSVYFTAPADWTRQHRKRKEKESVEKFNYFQFKPMLRNEPPQALASMSMHTKRNVCAIIKLVTSLH